eukprot:CAMPEP_0172468880 /NCGR_PEP_ID=MMETSP1065-20121228/62352_1 /TAXON_ID=265537 /ORGANISM="Amphiprora paludosa, Strain CCMP125" /LENGTH=36 /DNA_ID= /DNA_START= /DNA_END= /DNA_ORIENTATION=
MARIPSTHLTTLLVLLLVTGPSSALLTPKPVRSPTR